MKSKFLEFFLKGIAFALGIGATALVGVTITGTINSFSSGETISASTINENFSTLKTAIEGIDPQYSTSEVATHKVWIDGKTIYRKTIYFAALPNAGSGGFVITNQAHGITYDQITSLSGHAFVGSAYYALPMPQQGGQILITATSTNVSITAYDVDRSAMSAYVIMEYTK